MNQELSIQPTSSPAAVLTVLAVTVALVVWLRHDALDIYWQQTRHSQLGLTELSDSHAWAGGMQISHTLTDTLNAQQDRFTEFGQRLTLATNIVLNVPEPGGHIRLPARVLASATAKTSPSPVFIPLAAKTNAGKAPVVDLPPLANDGRIVLTSQDKVLLVGDSMMQGDAPHVARALQKANIGTVDLSRQSTGLTYPTYFDWPATVQKAIPDAKITVMVVFLGANDTWDIYIGGRAERFGSEKWQSVYASRIDSMVKFAESQNVRVVWLGAPNMGREKINSGVRILNHLYSAEANDGMARYVSTREILGGNSETYQKHITTQDGKIITVRTDDGIHFTPVGQEMLSNLILRQFAIPALKKSS